MTISLDSSDTIRLGDMYCTKTTFDDDLCQGIDDKGATWDILKIGSKI